MFAEEGHDPKVVAGVRRLLDDDDSTCGSGEAEGAAHPAEQGGQVLGRYELIEQIGEGGFGSVWLAEQREPIQRRVALKIIKLGMDTRQVIARFEGERQALARMDHPNIARVFDAGATDTGRPYFVMEYIEGVPILEYCDRERLDTRARLELFGQVCHAIQHAHQKGIIHRDIKPSNVLVTVRDGVAAPIVIDFGIAKATDTDAQGTALTQHRQLVGTPTYMSPEQAEMSGLDIDTRSDIYSLGVLLYELLTGTTPFAASSVMQAGFTELMRMIRETEPHKPSTRLNSLGDTATATAQRRRTDARQLSTMLRGDLDWIAMKCLEKDRTRRYDTASGLAADIRRHLDDEPVLAGPPSATYRLSKYIKRNKGPVAGAAALAAVVLLGLAGTSAGMAWAMREKARADKAATDATLAAAAETDAKNAAIEQARRAERELGRATEIKQIVKQMLTGVRPENARGADITLLKGILDETAARLAGGEIADEQIAAELHAVVGSAYEALNLHGQAEEHLAAAAALCERALGEEHHNTLAMKLNLAGTYSSLGRMDEAEDLYREVLETATRVNGEEDLFTASVLTTLAAFYAESGRIAEAEPMTRRALDVQTALLGAEHPHALSSASNLAALLVEQARYDEAEPLMLRTLEIERSVLGDLHPGTLGTITNLGLLYLSMRRIEDALRTLEPNLDDERRVLTMRHPWTRANADGLAYAYLSLDRRDDAASLWGELIELETARADAPSASPATLNAAAWTLLTHAMEELRNPSRAVGYAQRACEKEEAAGGDDLAYYLDTLALAQHHAGDDAAAAQTQHRAIELLPPGEPESGMRERLAEYEAAAAARLPRRDPER